MPILRNKKVKVGVRKGTSHRKVSFTVPKRLFTLKEITDIIDELRELRELAARA